MHYVSTRGQAPELDFAEALVAGLADDGGLYVPDVWPKLRDLPDLAACTTYAETAAVVMAPFVGGAVDGATLRRCCDEAYATFDHPAVVPLVQLDHRRWLAELFHGPTLAFKDVALQLVGRLFDVVLACRDERLTVIGATSGDTGSAAIEAVRGKANIDVVMLYPHGRVSDVQRRQMTTVDEPNVHVVAVDGTFDDCQNIVKAMFADPDLRARRTLSAVNSINWGRVMAQVVYYVTASRALSGPVTFSVPTGNFGNVYAGWVARRMGADIDGLVVSTNSNDILFRFLDGGDMTIGAVTPTLSPSMDIQVSSNFERLLFEMNDRDGAMTAEQLGRFAATGHLGVEPDQRAEHLDGVFSAVRVDDAETLAEIRRVHERCGIVVDPHTATATHAAERAAAERSVIALATAHPAKFPDAVELATGARPDVPRRLAELEGLAERVVRLPADLHAVIELVDRVTVAT